MLIVVENGNLHSLTEFLLDIETLRRLDILEIDSPEGGFERCNDIDQLVGIVLRQLDIEYIDVGKLLEQAALALHHWLGRQRADVAQTKHRGAIGDHRDQIAARGQFGCLAGVRHNCIACGGHPRRVGERKIPLVGQTLGRHHRNLAVRGRTMIIECRRDEILIHCSFSRPYWVDFSVLKVASPACQIDCQLQSGHQFCPVAPRHHRAATRGLQF